MLLIDIINSATSSGGFLPFDCDIKWWVSATRSGGLTATSSGGFLALLRHINLTMSQFQYRMRKDHCWGE